MVGVGDWGSTNAGTGCCLGAVLSILGELGRVNQFSHLPADLHRRRAGGKKFGQIPGGTRGVLLEQCLLSWVVGERAPGI